MADPLKLEGSKIILRTPNDADQEAFDQILDDKESMRALIPFFGGADEWSDEDLSSSYNKFTLEKKPSSELSLAIVSKENNQVVGCCGFKNIDHEERTAEYGIILSRSVWGKGISKQAHLLCLDWAFEELKLKEIFFYTDEHNLRMIGFFEKHGIRFKGTKERQQYFIASEKEWPKIKKKLS